MTDTTDIKTLRDRAASEVIANKGLISAELAMILINQLEAERQQADKAENSELEQRLADAEHQLHMRDLAIFNVRNQRKAQFKKRREAEARVKELELDVVEGKAQGVELLRDSIPDIETSIEDTRDLNHYCTDFAANLRAGRKL